MILTTHRRESFGEAMSGNLHALRSFVDSHADTALIFPVHPNPAVRSCATAILGGHDRIHLLDPLDYVEFIYLLSQAWLIVSDSGGVQEEAPSLGKPLLILRENTERPEAVESGAAILVGGCSDRLGVLLQEAYAEAPWMRQAQRAENPFGHGDAGNRIVEILKQVAPQKSEGRKST